MQPNNAAVQQAGFQLLVNARGFLACLTEKRRDIAVTLDNVDDFEDIGAVAKEDDVAFEHEAADIGT